VFLSHHIGMDYTTLPASNPVATDGESRVANLDHVTRSFGDFSLKRINLQVNPGTVLLIAGANGAGKSTLLDLLMGTVEPDEGTVTVFGRPRSKLTQSDREAIGCSLDRKLLPDGLSVRLFLKSVALACGTWDHEMARTLLDHFGVDSSKKVKELSEGMKKKLGITAALSRRSRLLLLDEPFAGLDAESQERVVKELDAAKKSGTGVVLTSHQFDKLDGLVDDILVLRHGELTCSMGGQSTRMSRHALSELLPPLL